MRGLGHPRGIIYLIRNLKNGRCYIGQTTRSFSERYGRLWWTKMHNTAMKEDLKTFGKDNFEIIILERSKTAKELAILENEYAERYNAYLPDGYNEQSCIKSYSSKCCLSKLSRIELNNPSGKDVVITKPIDFCIRNNLSPKCIYLILRGDRFFHKGWTKKGNKRKLNPRIKDYILYDHDGKRYNVSNLSAFCKERKLNYDSMRQMIAGYIDSSQGYGLSPESTKNPKWQYIATITKDGVDKVITNVRMQSKEVGMNSRFMYQLVGGRVESYKGWTVKTLTKRPLHVFRREQSEDLKLS